MSSPARKQPPTARTLDAFGLPIETVAAILVAAAADHVRADSNGTGYWSMGEHRK